jgi:DNA-binding response OmpR family regulator
MKILIVEDDRDICEILEFNLLNEGFEVECAYSAEDGLEKLTPSHTLILLDVMMGGMSGYKMAETIRKENNTTPIIFLTAKDTENDMLTGFSVGGDDYISKPFSIKEVIARVKAVGKRLAVAVDSENKETVFGDLKISHNLKELTLGEEKIALTKTEFEILALLADNPDRVFSREKIIETIWEETTFITERTVDVHITRLRKKMGDYGQAITNRSGYGYRFDISKI